jgi:hypothetical protein
MSGKGASGSAGPERSFAGVQKKIAAKLSDCRGLASLARDAADPAQGKSPKELITAQVGMMISIPPTPQRRHRRHPFCLTFRRPLTVAK